MKYSIPILFLIIFSCKPDSKPGLNTVSEKTSTYAMYGFLIEEFSYSQGILQEQIIQSLGDGILNEIPSVKAYDSLTKIYLKFLNQTESELMNALNSESELNYSGGLSKKEYVNNYFFSNKDYSQKAIEFISKTDRYRNEIKKLGLNDNLRRKIDRTLNTGMITNRKGEKIKHMDYFFKDMPLISVLAYLEHKEKCVLEFENEYLKSIEPND